MGIDYGSVRVGVAISDPLRIIAQGIAVLKNSTKLFDEIRTIAREYDVETIVVGMPFTVRGERGEKAAEVGQFITRLRDELSLEVVECDERYTSRMAHETLHTMGVPKKKRRSKERIDAMASALILQEYLNDLKR